MNSLGFTRASKEKRVQVRIGERISIIPHERNIDMKYEKDRDKEESIGREAELDTVILDRFCVTVTGSRGYQEEFDW